MRRPLLVGLCALFSCEGAITLPDPVTAVIDPDVPSLPGVDPCEGATLQVPAPVLRRLTPEQLANSWRDVLADAQPAPLLDAPAGATITELEVERLGDAAAELVKRGRHLAFVPCDPAGAGSATCAQAFIQAFGRFAFRRPLDTAELTSLTGRYAATRALAGVTPAITFREAIDTVAEVMLQSPQLTYVHERGDPAAPGPRPLTGYERAARLSFLLWNTTPDAALLDAARDGALDAPEGVRAQAERLLADPRAHLVVRRFASRWLGLDADPKHPALEMVPKSAERYPLDSPALRTAMRDETESLFERAFFDESGSFDAVLTSRKARVNKSLAQLYGVTGPATDTAYQWVDLPETRAGVFTRAAFLTTNAADVQPSPVRRGMWIYRYALGRALGDPPADVDNTPPKPSASALSVREQIEARTQGAVCQSCHSLINPIGHTLGHFDAIGQWQANDTGMQGGVAFSVPIDDAATLKAGDVTGPVQGPAALALALARSRMAKEHIADAWLERALERKAGPAEACLQHRARTAMLDTGDMREVLLTLLSSDEALSIEGGTP